jgi:hypothetical protein
MNDTTWTTLTEDDLEYHPTDADLDFARARTEPEYRATSAQWCFLDGRRANLISSRDRRWRLPILRAALECHREGDNDPEAIVRVERAIAEMRSDDLLAEAHSEVALERLPNDLHRIEFAILALHAWGRRWPNTEEVIEFCGTVYGWTDEQTCDVLNEAINDPDFARVGVILSPVGHVSEAMAVDLPSDVNPTADRLYVTAEAQRTHGLHDIFAAWDYTSPFVEEDDQ